MSVNQIHNTVASQTIDTDTTTNGTKVHVPYANALFVESIVSSRTDGTFTTTLQHSHDGSTWYDLIACTAQSADGTQTKEYVEGIDGAILQFIRAKVVSTSTTDGATVVVNIYYNNMEP